MMGGLGLSRLWILYWMWGGCSLMGNLFYFKAHILFPILRLNTFCCYFHKWVQFCCVESYWNTYGLAIACQCLLECCTQKGKLWSKDPFKYHVRACSEAVPNRNCQGCQALDIEIAMSIAHTSSFPGGVNLWTIWDRIYRRFSPLLLQLR